MHNSKELSNLMPKDRGEKKKQKALEIAKSYKSIKDEGYMLKTIHAQIIRYRLLYSLYISMNTSNSFTFGSSATKTWDAVFNIN